MAAEDVRVPVAPKIARFLYFVGAGFICSAAINKWRDYERESNQKRQQQHNDQLPLQIASDVFALILELKGQTGRQSTD